MLEEKILTSVDSKLLSCVKTENGVVKIDAEGMHYKDLNNLLRAVSSGDAEKIEVRNVCGQRYIGTDLDKAVQIDIYGTPGNDLGAFMSGPKIVVHGNGQDGCGNTMNDGQIVIHGGAGDITGHSMRGGRVFVRDDVGYRVGIHMKEFQGMKPQLAIGGVAQDFLAEYMAGGVILLLGLTLPKGERCQARFVGTGMHGGVLYERGDLLTVGEGTRVMAVGKRDMAVIEALARDFCSYFGIDYGKVMDAKFRKIVPVSKRPYEKVYSH